MKMQCQMMEAKTPKQQETYNALIISISHQRSSLLQIKNSVMLTKHCKFYFSKITSLPWMCDKIVDENPRTKRQGIQHDNPMPDDGSQNTKATRMHCSGLLQIKDSVMLTKNCKFAKYTHDCN